MLFLSTCLSSMSVERLWNVRLRSSSLLPVLYLVKIIDKFTFKMQLTNHDINQAESLDGKSNYQQ